MKHLLSFPLLGLLWCLHFLPLPWLRALGAGLGRLLFRFGRERRQVALTNLALCFPHMSEVDREQLARRHFIVFAQALLDRTLVWWASRRRLEALIDIRGAEHLSDPAGRPIIMLSPHFVGLDAGAIRISMRVPGCSIYSRQKNPVFDRLVYNGRRRFSDVLLLSRQDGLRKIIKAMREGRRFYYLPDMDFGPDDSIFVPFFGVPAATIPALSRLVRLTGARVVPCISRLTAQGYVLEVLPSWDNFPGDSIEADTLRMNRFIESQVLTMPEQYFWLHKRFKTRPPGEQRFYP
ncbi:MAG: lipid A biosynthesis acyltransferase [Dechloromonas sp.]|nr:lipid A biosynthesis acyltransferase [Dechloromonas sp.]